MNPDKHAVTGTILSQPSDVLIFVWQGEGVVVIIVVIGEQETSNTAGP